MAEHLIAGLGETTPAGRSVHAADPIEIPRRSQKPRIVLLFADLAIAQIFCLLALQFAGRFDVGVDVGGSVASARLAIVLALIFPAIVGISGLYRRSYLMSWRRQAEIGLRVLVYFVGAMIGALFLFAEEIPWELRKVLFLYQAMMAVWLLALRPLAGAALSRQFAVPRTERVLIVGEDGWPRRSPVDWKVPAGTSGSSGSLHRNGRPRDRSVPTISPGSKTCLP
ncbi:MAG: hypothetical protein R3E97_09445 [Candidatus Eisenbacteria bacterium]